MKMKHLIGKECKLHIKKDGEDLYYSAYILDVNDYLISFQDKYGEVFSFPIKDIDEISLKKVGE